MKLKTLAPVLSLALLAACGQASEPTPPATDAAAPAALKAPAGTYRLDKTHASLTWSIPHLGLSNYTARFTTVDAAVVLDPADPQASTVVLTIDPRSVRADYPGDYRATHVESAYQNWDEDIALNPNFLDARNAAQITFTSTRVEPTGPRTARVTGDLAFRGQTHPVTLDVTLNGELESHPLARVAAIGFSAQGTFQPSQFGVNLLGGALGDTATVRFEGEFLHQSPSE